LEFSFSNVCDSPFFLPITRILGGGLSAHSRVFGSDRLGNVHAADVCLNQGDLLLKLELDLNVLQGVLLVMGLWFCLGESTLHKEKNGLPFIWGSCRATFSNVWLLFFLEK
jgi:hypothetical protein